MFKVKFKNIQSMSLNVMFPYVLHIRDSNSLGGDSNLKSEMNLILTILNGQMQEYLMKFVNNTIMLKRTRFTIFKINKSCSNTAH